MAGALGLAPGGIKSEPGFAMNVKMEGDTIMTSPGAEDIYEDDQGDIDFSHYSSDIFLARLPKYLWKSWDKLGDDEEIEIGTLRVEGPAEDPTAVSLLQPGEIALGLMI